MKTYTYQLIENGAYLTDTNRDMRPQQAGKINAQLQRDLAEGRWIELELAKKTGNPTTTAEVLKAPAAEYGDATKKSAVDARGEKAEATTTKIRKARKAAKQEGAALVEAAVTAAGGTVLPEGTEVPAGCDDSHAGESDSNEGYSEYEGQQVLDEHVADDAPPATVAFERMGERLAAEVLNEDARVIGAALEAKPSTGYVMTAAELKKLKCYQLPNAGQAVPVGEFEVGEKIGKSAVYTVTREGATYELNTKTRQLSVPGAANAAPESPAKTSAKGKKGRSTKPAAEAARKPVTRETLQKAEEVPYNEVQRTALIHAVDHENTLSEVQVGRYSGDVSSITIGFLVKRRLFTEPTGNPGQKTVTLTETGVKEALRLKHNPDLKVRAAVTGRQAPQWIAKVAGPKGKWLGRNHTYELAKGRIEKLLSDRGALKTATWSADGWTVTDTDGLVFEIVRVGKGDRDAARKEEAQAAKKAAA